MEPTESFRSLAKLYASFPSVSDALKVATLAQWILESGRGNSRLAREHCNYGGLKYRDRMAGYATPVTYDAHDGQDKYCDFPSDDDFIKGYWHFIDSGPYGGWKNFTDDAPGYIDHIQKGGYCSQSDYPDKVKACFPEACRLLGLDSERVLVTDRDRPPRRALGDWSVPVLERVSGLRHAVAGKRPAGLEGLIVHFDAFRIRQTGNGPENSDQRSQQTLRYGQEQGFHYGTISRTGRIFVPENFSFDDWGYHAGKSICPATGRPGVSQYYVGFEMNNPGRLYETQDGVFCPWYNTVRDKDGTTILAGGRATRANEHDEWYTEHEVRRCEGGNIQPGWYLPFTIEQFEALANLVCYLAATMPTTFSVERVFGHDEVAPHRKNDPGGALAYPNRLMPMAEFRDYVRSRL